MFCPKCATQNIDGASFCRACGANISLVPQALAGQLPEAKSEDYSDRFSRRRRKRGEPTLDQGIRSLMMGIGFIVVSVMVDLYSPAGWTWWYWLLIPAFAMLGRGVSEIVRAKQARGELKAANSSPREISGTSFGGSLPDPRTGKLRAPMPSVTEGTTRHLGAEGPTRHFDPVTGEEKVQ